MIYFMQPVEGGPAVNQPTTVISVNGKDPTVLRANPSFLYVGRRNRRWVGSIWGNPYRVEDHGCGAAVALFRAEIEAALAGRPGKYPGQAFRVMAERIAELRGKTLGCWCGNWRPGEPEIECHAVVLAKLAEA